MAKYNPSDWQIKANGSNIDALHKSGLTFSGTRADFNTMLATTTIFTPEEEAERARLSALGVVTTEINPLTGGDDFVGEVSTLKLPVGVTDLTSGVGPAALTPVPSSATNVKGSSAGRTHLLIQSSTTGSGTRVHQEPNGNPVGLAAKYDFMFDPYEIDLDNYRIFNFCTFNYDPANTSTAVGNNGVALLGAKAVGTHWGVWPTIHFGFSDDGPGAAVPMKMYYFDTSDTAWRAPMIGGWRAGMSVTTGDYCTANNKIYQSGTTGTTGATAPSHTTGTISDGAVSWLFVRDVGAVWANIKGTVVFGDRDDLPAFGFPNVRVQLAKDALVWNGKAIVFAGSTGAMSWKLYPVSATDDVRIEYDSTHFMRFSKANNFMSLGGLARLVSTASDSSLSATPSVSGTETIVFSNASAINVTAFTGMLANQVFFVEATNANTTLVHGTNLRLLGAVNKTLGVDDCLMFKVNSSGTIAKQVT